MQVIMRDEKLIVIVGESQTEVPISLSQSEAMRDLLGAGAMVQYQDALKQIIQSHQGTLPS